MSHTSLPHISPTHRQDERLNTEFSQTDFTLDEGEQLLRDMQQLRDVMSSQAEIIQELEDRAHQVTPQRQRREHLPGPLPVSAICSYKNASVSHLSAVVDAVLC